VTEIKGIERVRFTTSNPKDLSEELMQCFTDLKKLCPHFHLPVQSGSNAILRRMNRKYTIEHYLSKVEKLHSYCPEIALTTDIIVGFPGETVEDFQATMDLVEKIRYHSVFSFKYSDRPPAKSCQFTDSVSREEKERRLATLQERLQQITLERNREYIGRRMELMVEGQSKAAGGQWSGRSGTNHIVNFQSHDALVPGQLVQVVIQEACLHSLRGKLLP
ncbi:MAG: radical SAM protein, partial [Desulfobulbaceae bacterium]|nr:radical SAM protein [Desulfobulbaceae bacterium]